MIENNPEYEGAMVFVPRCAKCGTKVINEDEIERGEVVESYVYSEKDQAFTESHKFDAHPLAPTFMPYKCPRCKTVFTKVVIPFKIIRA